MTGGSGGLRKKIRLIVVLSSLLLSLVLGVLLFFYYRLEPLVSSRLQETVKLSTNGLYDISFSRLKVNPFSGSVTIRDIVFKPNEAAYRRFKKLRINPSHLYEIKVEAIRLKRVHPITVYVHRDLIINSIDIQKPTIRVYYDKIVDKDSTKIDKRTTWQRISKYLHSIKIKEVQFRDIDFKYIDKTLAKTEINGVKNLSILVKDISIDSLSHLDKNRFYHTKEILVEVYDNHFESNDGLYKIQFDKVELSTRSKYAFVNGLRVSPKFAPLNFAEKLRYRKAQYSISAKKILFGAIDYKRLIDNRQFHAGTLEASGLNVDIFMNKAIPRKPVDHGFSFPHIMLKQLRLSSTIDTVRISGSRLNYSEYDPFTAKTGRITFNSLSGKIVSLSNDSSRLNFNPWVKANFIAYLYGKGKLDFNLQLNLLSRNQEYNFSGKLHKTQVRYFNPIARPLALLNLNSGQVDSAFYSVKADYRHANGTVKILYQDLGVGILKINRNGKIRKSTLRSLVANNVLLKTENPSPGRPGRIGKIDYYRPDSVSFYSMMWRSLFTGIRESIGLTVEREEAIQAQFKGLKGSNERKDKKEKRKKRKGKN